MLFRFLLSVLVILVVNGFAVRSASAQPQNAGGQLPPPQPPAPARPPVYVMPGYRVDVNDVVIDTDFSQGLLWFSPLFPTPTPIAPVSKVKAHIVFSTTSVDPTQPPYISEFDELNLRIFQNNDPNPIFDIPQDAQQGDNRATFTVQDFQGTFSLPLRFQIWVGKWILTNNGTRVFVRDGSEQRIFDAFYPDIEGEATTVSPVGRGIDNVLVETTWQKGAPVMIVDVIKFSCLNRLGFQNPVGEKVIYGYGGNADYSYGKVRKSIGTASLIEVPRQGPGSDRWRFVSQVVNTTIVPGPVVMFDATGAVKW